MTLIAADGRGTKVASSWRAAITSLRPPSGVIPRQRVYRVEHDQIGALDIFWCRSPTRKARASGHLQLTPAGRRSISRYISLSSTTVKPSRS